MVTLGEVEFSIVSDEKITKSNDITDYPVEDGSVISDNVERKPLVLSIAGMIKGDGAFEKLQLLRKYSDQGQIVTYSGRNALGNCVIESLTTIHDSTIKGGLIFNAEIKQILLAELQETNIDFEVVEPQTVQPSKNLGKKSITEVEQEEDYFVDPIAGKLPTLSNIEELAKEKSLLQKEKARLNLTQVDKFTSEERRENEPEKYYTRGSSASGYRR